MDYLFSVFVVKWAPLRMKTLLAIDIFLDYSTDLSGKAPLSTFSHALVTEYGEINKSSA